MMFTMTIYNKYQMLKIFISALLAIQIFGQIDPPTWPESFHQTFVQSYNTSKLHTSGKLYFDSKRAASRTDRLDGKNDQFCGSILPNVSTPCTHLIRDNKTYIVFPERRSCCMCCDAAHGCGVAPRDWLKSSKYVGQQTLEDQSFYKWSVTFGTTTYQYYATKSEERIPRRVNVIGIKTNDFIMNTYSTDPIQDSIFALPIYCTTACPASTICGKYRMNSIKTQ